MPAARVVVWDTFLGDWALLGMPYGQMGLDVCKPFADIVQLQSSMVFLQQYACRPSQVANEVQCLDGVLEIDAVLEVFTY